MFASLTDKLKFDGSIDEDRFLEELKTTLLEMKIHEGFACNFLVEEFLIALRQNVPKEDFLKKILNVCLPLILKNEAAIFELFEQMLNFDNKICNQAVLDLQYERSIDLSSSLIQLAKNSPDKFKSVIKKFEFCDGFDFFLLDMLCEALDSYDAKIISLLDEVLGSEMLNQCMIENTAYFDKTFNQECLELIRKAVQEEKIELIDICSQFSGGFGRIDYQGVLLACASTAAVKQYPFTPVVLQNIGEMHEFIETLSSNIESLSQCGRIHFIVQDRNHWVSGVCEVSQEGRLQILVVDSLGLSSETGSPSYASEGVIHQICDSNHGVDLYFSKLKRQHTPKGCSAFAIDDVRHLHTVERYLPHGQSLFSYLEKHSTPSDTIVRPKLDGRNHVFAATLPLHLMRTMHTVNADKFLSEHPEQEINSPVNKAQELPLVSFERHQKSQSKKKINARLEHKLHSLSERNLAYVHKHEKSIIMGSMSTFTLSNFKKQFVHKRPAPHC